jgi:hypothetical protein
MSGNDRRPPHWTLAHRGSSDHDRGAGPSVARLLREIYAAPSDPRYWDRLEARIVAGVRQHAVAGAWDAWAAAFGAWARAGLAAAGLAVLASGVAAWTSHDTESRVAYETVLDVRPPVPVLSDTRFIDVSEREATARYVFSH